MGFRDGEIAESVTIGSFGDSETWTKRGWEHMLERGDSRCGQGPVSMSTGEQSQGKAEAVPGVTGGNMGAGGRSQSWEARGSVPWTVSGQETVHVDIGGLALEMRQWVAF